MLSDLYARNLRRLIHTVPPSALEAWMEPRPQRSKRPRSEKSVPKRIAQLGHYGDIINILPIAQHYASLSGRPTTLICQQAYADILDGVSYAEAMVADPANLVSVLTTPGTLNATTDKPSDRPYNVQAWAQIGWEDRFSKLLPVFDRRSRIREITLAEKHLKFVKPPLLVSLSARSSPMAAKHQEELQRHLQDEFAKEFEIVDLSKVRGHRLYDLLGLYDLAAALVTVDTATLHLGSACSVPLACLLSSFSPTEWRASQPKGNVIYQANYGSPDAMWPSLKRAIRNRAIRWWPPRQSIVHVATDPSSPCAKLSGHAAYVYSPTVPSRSFICNGKAHSLVKELLKDAKAKLAEPDDIVLLADNAASFTPGFARALVHRLASFGWCSSFLTEGRRYRGVFAFTKRWLDQHEAAFPDFACGIAHWDTCLTSWLRLVSGMPDVSLYASYPEHDMELGFTPEARPVVLVDSQAALRRNRDVLTLALHTFDAKQLLAQSPVYIHVGRDEPKAPEPKRPPKMGRNSFHHSGDIGDIVYALPTIRELGGGDLFLTPDNRTPMSTREKMTPARAELIRTLLLQQSYIHSVTYAEEMPPVNYDLNQMRLTLRHEQLDTKPGFNLCRCYLKAFGLALNHDQSPWLAVDKAVEIPKHPVVISRTQRYRNPDFDWKRLLAHYRGQVIFVGTPDEHADFCESFGDVPYQPTKDLLELARVIAGAKLFVGNQSCPYAIAEGLKKPAILEDCPGGSNTLFSRPQVSVGFTQHDTPPEITAKSTPPPLRLRVNVRCIVEDFTGIGQLSEAFAAGLAARKAKVKLSPVRINGHIPDSLSRLLPVKLGGKFTTLTILPLSWIFEHLGKGEVLVTMWETTSVSPEAVEVINTRARMLIVPSDWCATIFACSGVEVPIRVVPLGVDPAVFTPGQPPPDNTFTFGLAGRYAHGGIRKGLEKGVEAFLEAFPTQPNVRLRVKLHGDCQITLPADERIDVIRKFLDWEDLADWYRSLHVFMCLSLGEGFGLHPLQAMACGVPVIGPNHTGLGMFHSEESGWVLPWTTAKSVEGGLWHVPDSPVHLLKTLVGSPAEIARKRYGALKIASKFSWEASLDRLVQAL